MQYLHDDKQKLSALFSIHDPIKGSKETQP